MHQTSKKLVLVLAIFALITKASKENDVTLNWIPCICYPIWFKKNKIQALIDSGSEFNAIILVYILKLGLKVCHTNIEA